MHLKRPYFFFSVLRAWSLYSCPRIDLFNVYLWWHLVTPGKNDIEVQIMRPVREYGTCPVRLLGICAEPACILCGRNVQRLTELDRVMARSCHPSQLTLARRMEASLLGLALQEPSSLWGTAASRTALGSMGYHMQGTPPRQGLTDPVVLTKFSPIRQTHAITTRESGRFCKPPV